MVARANNVTLPDIRIPALALEIREEAPSVTAFPNAILIGGLTVDPQGQWQFDSAVVPPSTALDALPLLADFRIESKRCWEELLSACLRYLRDFDYTETGAGEHLDCVRLARRWRELLTPLCTGMGALRPNAHPREIFTIWATLAAQLVQHLDPSYATRGKASLDIFLGPALHRRGGFSTTPSEVLTQAKQLTKTTLSPEEHSATYTAARKFVDEVALTAALLFFRHATALKSDAAVIEPL
jgi:hypothetical protein